MKARCDLQFFQHPESLSSTHSTLVSVQQVNTGLYNRGNDTITNIHHVASFSAREYNKMSQTRDHCITALKKKVNRTKQYNQVAAYGRSIDPEGWRFRPPCYNQLLSYSLDLGWQLFELNYCCFSRVFKDFAHCCPLTSTWMFHCLGPRSVNLEVVWRV